MPGELDVLSRIPSLPVMAHGNQSLSHVPYVPARGKTHPKVHIGEVAETLVHPSDGMEACPSDQRRAPNQASPPRQKLMREEPLPWHDSLQQQLLVVERTASRIIVENETNGGMLLGNPHPLCQQSGGN